jgi:hypothetical protein
MLAHPDYLPHNLTTLVLSFFLVLLFNPLDFSLPRGIFFTNIANNIYLN